MYPLVLSWWQGELSTAAPKLTPSEVFNEQLDGAGKAKTDVLEFTEDSITISRFLDLAFDSELKPESSTTGTSEVELCGELLGLVRFMQKYKCSTLFRQLRTCAIDHLREGRLPAHSAFVLGAAADEIELCAAAIQQACKIEPDWRTNRHAPIQYWICHADPGTLPQALWEMVPKTYSWAWTRGWAQGMGANEHRHVRMHELTAVIREFKKAINESKMREAMARTSPTGKSVSL